MSAAASATPAITVVDLSLDAIVNATSNGVVSVPVESIQSVTPPNVSELLRSPETIGKLVLLSALSLGPILARGRLSRLLGDTHATSDEREVVVAGRDTKDAEEAAVGEEESEDWDGDADGDGEEEELELERL